MYPEWAMEGAGRLPMGRLGKMKRVTQRRMAAAGDEAASLAESLGRQFDVGHGERANAKVGMVDALVVVLAE